MVIFPGQASEAIELRKNLKKNEVEQIIVQLLLDGFLVLLFSDCPYTATFNVANNLPLCKSMIISLQCLHFSFSKIDFLCKSIKGKQQITTFVGLRSLCIMNGGSNLANLNLWN